MEYTLPSQKFLRVRDFPLFLDLKGKGRLEESVSLWGGLIMYVYDHKHISSLLKEEPAFQKKMYLFSRILLM